MQMKVAIIGATGYGGVVLVRILHLHPRVSIHSIHATSLHGEFLSETYPLMQDLVEETLQPAHAEELSMKVDVVCIATLSGFAMAFDTTFFENGVKVIDLSRDFHITDPVVYKQWYGIDAADQHLLEDAVYGLTEWVSVPLTEKQLVSNPVCYPTSALLGLAPLMKE